MGETCCRAFDLAPTVVERGGGSRWSAFEDDLAGKVRTIENLFVPLRDGTRLAAKVWRPAETDAPVPAILEYLPYRKRDGTRMRDQGMHMLLRGPRLRRDPAGTSAAPATARG